MTSSASVSGLSRRTWLQHAALGVAALTRPGGRSLPRLRLGGRLPAALEARLARTGDRLDPAPWDALAQRAVEAAQRAGARYAEARLTRTVAHDYNGQYLYYFNAYQNDQKQWPEFASAQEFVGVGVRALVGGGWGFSASAVVTPDEVVRLAQDAVAQAKAAAQGPPVPVDLGHSPVATGHWSPPGAIDPFTISIEEKFDTIASWANVAETQGLGFAFNKDCELHFGRQEQVVATSEGARFTQTVYETSGDVRVDVQSRGVEYDGQQARLHGLETASTGWDLILAADVPEQLRSGQLQAEIRAYQELMAIPAKPASVGKYTLVCDGATMAALVEATLGVATQLDRALGYEANGNGTSWIDDPLAMVGTAQVAAPLVTLTGNRSVPQDLATVKWDAEGVEPEPFTLIKDGVLKDFQTTREQAAWLAPYYQQHGRPGTSHGCAAAQSAHVPPMQHLPNLVLEPNPAAVRLEDLIADVKDGIFLANGVVSQLDSQVRTGLLIADPNPKAGSYIREIKNGRLGKKLTNGAVFFSSPELWKGLHAVGGASTQGRVSFGVLLDQRGELAKAYRFGKSTYYNRTKGEPRQQASHTVRAVAATLPNIPLINPSSIMRQG